MKIIKKYQGTVPDNKIMNTYSSSQTDTYSSDYENKHFVTKKFIKVRATQNQGLTTAGNMTVLFQNVDTNIGDAFQLPINIQSIISALVASMTVGGKALGKSIANKYSTPIVHKVGIVLNKFSKKG